MFKTKWLIASDSGSALSSVVEHYLHTVGVAGSKPAPRTSLRLNEVNAKVAATKRSVDVRYLTAPRAAARQATAQFVSLNSHISAINSAQNWSSFSLNSTLNVVSDP